LNAMFIYYLLLVFYLWVMNTFKIGCLAKSDTCWCQHLYYTCQKT
jgi:hypothetical protein